MELFVTIIKHLKLLNREILLIHIVNLNLDVVMVSFT